MSLGRTLPLLKRHSVRCYPGRALANRAWAGVDCPGVVPPTAPLWQSVRELTSLKAVSRLVPLSAAVGASARAPLLGRSTATAVGTRAAHLSTELGCAAGVSERLPTSSEAATESTLSEVLTTRAGSFFRDYLRLSKYRLTGMVVLSAQAGYLLYPVDARVAGVSPGLVDETAPRALDQDTLRQVGLRNAWERVRRFGWLSVGTFLCAAAANTMNQIMEARLDSRMKRTRSRPLPAGRLSVGHALAFACICGMTGVMSLYWGTNPQTALLGLGNTLLYVSVYTPLKVLTPLNTWIGALVGAIPPLMGWAAASSDTGTAVPGVCGKDAESLRGGFPLAALLFFWQIPHFHALAVLCRADYMSAGYRMLALTSPVWNARLAWVSSAALIPTGVWFVREHLCADGFGFGHTLLALWLTLHAGQLVRRPLDIAVARRLFRQTILYLPLALALTLLTRTRDGKPSTLELRYEAGHWGAPAPAHLTFPEADLSSCRTPNKDSTDSLTFSNEKSSASARRLRKDASAVMSGIDCAFPDAYIAPLPYLPPPRF
jgi:protoheme IX farnesyltransferase